MPNALLFSVQGLNIQISSLIVAHRYRELNRKGVSIKFIPGQVLG
jgi:hypothetical protein